MFYGGGAKHIYWLSQLHDQPKSHVRSLYTYYVVQSTTSMQSMLKLGGLGACPPRKILKNIACLEMDFGDIFTYKKQSNCTYLLLNFKLE